ncbi:MAG: BON domain-containing protein [Sedimenticola sp.]
MTSNHLQYHSIEMSTLLTVIFGIIVGSAMLQGCSGAIIGGTAAGISIVTDPRTLNGTLMDQHIEQQVANHLYEHHDIFVDTAVEATSYNQRVLLTGQIKTEALRRRIGRYATQLTNVKVVINRITISKPLTLSREASDLALTAKVKIVLLGAEKPGFAPTQIKVVSEDGRVYLLGFLQREQGDKVTELVRHVRGVEHLVKVFDYVR